MPYIYKFINCTGMKKSLIIIFALFLFSSAKAQYPEWMDLSKWDPISLKKANTAVNTDYLTEEEKLVIFITNLARMDGPLFITSILDPFLEGEPKTRYTKSLQRDLAKVKNLQPLHPEKDLYTIAFGHAVKSGKRGSVGHEGFDSRFKPFMGKYNMVAENCAYGFEKGGTNAIQLLIDEDVSNLGHRKNMLHTQFTSIGVSIQPHKTYEYNCVMDFGKKAK